MEQQKKHPLEETPSPIRRRRLHWGEAKMQLSSLITPSGHDLLRDKAKQLQLSKSDLIEYLSRCLDDPAVEKAITRQIKA